MRDACQHATRLTRTVRRECLTTFNSCLPPSSALLTMAQHHNSWHGMLLALVTLPPVLFALYFFSQFPRVPDTIEIHPSLASLGASHRVLQIYPEDLYEGGAYFDTPYGRVRSAACSDCCR